MGPEAIENRVARLERRMTRLEELPSRLDALTSQILHLRGEMQGEFSSVRAETQQLGVGLQGEMQSLNERTLVQMRMLHEELVSRIAVMGEGVNRPKKRGARREK
jgi:hypothetical protein